MTTNCLEPKKYLPKYFTTQIYVYIRIQYIHTTITTKGIIQYQINRMLYKNKIHTTIKGIIQYQINRMLYKNKIHTTIKGIIQYQINHMLYKNKIHTTIKYIIQYQINRMIYKNKIRSTHPNKYNTKHTITLYILIPKYNTPKKTI